MEIKTKNIDVEVNLILSDLKLKNIDVIKFKSPNQDFSLTMKKQDFTEINVRGNKISIPPIKINENSSLNSFDKIQFNLDVYETIIDKNKFTNPIVNFEKKNNEFVSLNIRLDGEKDYHQINIKDVENKKIFLLETNFVPGLLNIFDIDLEINTGSLKIEGEKNKCEMKSLKP